MGTATDFAALIRSLRAPLGLGPQRLARQLGPSCSTGDAREIGPREPLRFVGGRVLEMAEEAGLAVKRAGRRRTGERGRSR